MTPTFSRQRSGGGLSDGARLGARHDRDNRYACACACACVMQAASAKSHRIERRKRCHFTKPRPGNPLSPCHCQRGGLPVSCIDLHPIHPSIPHWPANFFPFAAEHEAQGLVSQLVGLCGRTRWRPGPVLFVFLLPALVMVGRLEG